MEKQPINPWRWQEKFGFSHAWKVDGAQSIVFLAGQGPVSAEGQIVGQGDFEAQARRTFENIQAVLEQAGTSFGAVVKLTVYLTDIGHLLDYARVRNDFIVTSEPPASTALEVSALALPGMMIEVDAIAVW